MTSPSWKSWPGWSCREHGGCRKAEQALLVLFVGEDHRRGGTMVTDTYNSGLTLEHCLNCQLYPKRHLDRCCGMTD